MVFETYTDDVENNLRAQGYDEVDGDTGAFEFVYAKREKGITIGIANTMATVVNASEMRTGDLRERADELRELLKDGSYSKFSVGEAMIGFVVFAVSEDTEGLAEFATEEFPVKSGNSFVFPLVYELESETLYRHGVPRMKNRGAYKLADGVCDDVFDLGEDDDSGGFF